MLIGLAAEVVGRLESALEAERQTEAAELVRPLVRVASRLSTVLWPFGSWATHPDDLQATEVIRQELGLTADHTG